jgi:perosamine synthetase
MKKIPVAVPFFKGNEKKYLNQCIDTGWVSSKGEFIEKLETGFAKLVGTDYATSTSNGTVSLHLALVALGLKPGDEVIMPDLTYIATANTVRYCGAIPVFVDVEKDSWNIDPKLIEEKITKKTKGIVPVHLYGLPANMDAINDIAKKYGLFVLEDAAEAHGAKYKGKMVGGLGDLGSFSFFGNKIITTGEGGMVTTNSKELYEKMRLLKSQGVDPNKSYWHIMLAYNYRMTNMQAAVGLGQLEDFDWHLAQRKRVAQSYINFFKEHEDLFSYQIYSKDYTHAYWMFSIYLKEKVKISRDELMRKLAEKGIETRPVFYPMHIMPPYKHEGNYPVTEDISSRSLNIPTHAHLTEVDIINICKLIMNYSIGK